MSEATLTARHMSTVLAADGVVIGKIAAGTTITREMLNMMVTAHMNGEKPRTWIDGDVVDTALTSPASQAR